MMSVLVSVINDQLEDEYEAVDKKNKKQKKKSRGASTSFYVPSPDHDKDDVEKMKERAEKNKLFEEVDN